MPYEPRRDEEEKNEEDEPRHRRAAGGGVETLHPPESTSTAASALRRPDDFQPFRALPGGVGKDRGVQPPDEDLLAFGRHEYPDDQSLACTAAPASHQVSDLHECARLSDAPERTPT